MEDTHEDDATAGSSQDSDSDDPISITSTLSADSMDFKRSIEAMIASTDGLVNGVFKPERLLGVGRIYCVFGGFFVTDANFFREIAVKFTPPKYEKFTFNEYEVYQSMNAVENLDVERYGIPNVYYFDRWGESGPMMMGLTLLDNTLQKIDDLVFRAHPVNALIVFRDVLLAAKYMHSCGINHGDLILNNIMVRKHRIFLIDFDYYGEKIDTRTIEPHDLVRFLCSLCSKLGVVFGWENITHNEAIPLKRDTKRTYELILTLQSDILRTFFAQFARHLFIDCVNLTNADYDRFYHLANDAIGTFGFPEPVLFRWLTPEERAVAIEDLRLNPIPDITEISLEPILQHLSTIPIESNGDNHGNNATGT